MTVESRKLCRKNNFYCVLRRSKHVGHQHDSFRTDTGNTASESPSEQDKIKELMDKPEML